MGNNKTKIVFLNQMAGPLFRELAEDMAKVYFPSLLYTGHPDTAGHGGNQFLTIKAGPQYSRRSNFMRLISWLYYFICSIYIVWRQPNKSLLFIVSNPPFLGLIGVLFKLVRRQKYIVLVYDIYPDLLVGLNQLRNGIVVNIWDFLNCLVYRHSSKIITIGEDMAQRLKKKFDVRKADAREIICMPCWADINTIQPKQKTDNWFAVKYGLLGKTIVLYSGNMGNTHDIESIVEVVKQLKGESKIHFLIIGEGAKWSFIEKSINDYRLQNITLLPFQPEEVLPYSLSAGDIGIVAYQQGTEGCMIPSKTYYYMSAGLAILVTCVKETDLSEMVKEQKCGVHVKSGDVERMKRVILEMNNDHVVLEKYKKAARETAEKLYSRTNTRMYIETLRTII